MRGSSRQRGISSEESVSEREAVGRPRSLPPELSADRAFAVLENERRRNVLEFLQEEDGASTLSDLAELIAARENDVDREALSSDQRKRVYIGLYQRHLPKMDDAGVVDYDQRAGDVTLTETGAALYEYLDREHEGGGDWPALYVGLSALGLGLLLTGVGTPAQLSATAQWLVLVVVVGGYLLLSSLQLGRHLGGGTEHGPRNDRPVEG
jgi:DNA-binding transcriptional ArsR family regulator